VRRASVYNPWPRRVFWLGVAALALLAALQIAFLIEPFLVRLTAEPRAVTPRGDLAAEERTNIEIFERTSPSVVFITTTERVLNPWTRNVLEVPRGNGSGFVWDEHGHVVTNFHVIAGAQAAQVRLADHRAYPAALVGASPAHDLAVLRISVPIGRPPPVPVGSSADLKVGQKVFAIGNPFGLDYTLTTGVISALDRSIQTSERETLEHAIQTDAAINPGNSGGPLIDSAGRLIGINTAIYSPSGAYAGIGFAVPVDIVNRVVPDLIAYGRFTQPSLGIVADEDVNRVVTERLGVEGVLVLGVRPGSSGEAAGLRGSVVARDGSIVPGDVIRAVGGEPVRSVADLLRVLGERKVGDSVRLDVLRKGGPVTLEALLERTSA
jgi:S1-C subfamily serine protease